MNIKKVTCFKIGYFLFPITATSLYHLFDNLSRFGFLFLNAIISSCISFPLGILLHIPSINDSIITKAYADLPFSYATNETIIGITFSFLLLLLGYIQWFVIVPKVWGSLRKIIKRDS